MLYVLMHCPQLISPGYASLSMSSNTAKSTATTVRSSGRARRPTAKAAQASATSRKRVVSDSDDDASDAPTDDPTDKEVTAPSLQAMSSSATIIIDDDNLSSTVRKFNIRFNVAENSNEEVLGKY